MCDRVIREKAVLFGPERRLVGVWTAAPSSTHADDAPTVLIFNSGLVPHSGIWRLHVRLARALAERGVSSLRFDLSGIGDSGAPGDGLPLDQIVRQDIDAAIDYVREIQRAERVVTLGLCSGARDALDTAMRHDAVVGVVAIDLIADLQTWQFHAVHFGERLLNLQSWKNTLSGRNGRLQSMLGVRSNGETRATTLDDAPIAEAGVRTLLSRSELHDRISQLVRRNARLLFLFSGGLEDNYNHERQFRTALPDLARAPGLTVDYFPEANHTFKNAGHQRALIARVSEWCADGFPHTAG